MGVSLRLTLMQCSYSLAECFIYQMYHIQSAILLLRNQLIVEQLKWLTFTLIVIHITLLRQQSDSRILQLAMIHQTPEGTRANHIPYQL